MSAEGKKKDKGFIALLVLIIVCACLMIAAVTTLGIGMSNGMGGTNEPVQGEQGMDGSKWYTGDGAPSESVGKEGDFYLNKQNGDVYEKNATGWALSLNIKGADADTVPRISDGSNGEVAGNWYVGSRDTGVKAGGTDGLTPTIGADGYWYIGGKKTEQRAWPEITYENNQWYLNGQPVGKVEVPHIGDADKGEQGGYWYIGETCTGVKAEAETIVPYIGKNGNWWVGDNDTHQPASTFLTIDETESGEFHWFVNGVDTGFNVQGEKGADGETPYVGQNGNWWIGTTDTHVSAKGDAYIDEDGHWVVNGVKTGFTSGGTVWHSGEGAPSADATSASYVSGNTGDFYLDTENGAIYLLTKDGETSAWVKLIDALVSFDAATREWVIMGNHTGIYATQWFKGNGEPTISGHEGDYYINLSNGDIYMNNGENAGTTGESSSWVRLTNFSGPTASWRSGSGTPTKANLPGIPGDMYIDTDTGCVYQFGASGWTMIDDFVINGTVGQRGTRMFAGKGAPTEVKDALPGDYYFDTKNGVIYTLKTVVNDQQQWEAINLDDPLAGNRWLSGPVDPADVLDENSEYPELKALLEGASNYDIYINSETKSVWQLTPAASGDSAWVNLGSLDIENATHHATKWFYGTEDPTDADFDKKVPGALDDDFYLQTFYAFSGLTGFKMYALQNTTWNLILDMTSKADAETEYNIPNYDALKSFRDSVNGKYTEKDNPSYSGSKITLTGAVTIPEGDTSVIGDKTAGTNDYVFSGTLDGQWTGGSIDAEQGNTYIQGINGTLFGTLKNATLQNLDLYGDLSQAEFDTSKTASVLAKSFGLAKALEESNTFYNVRLTLTSAQGSVVIYWDNSQNVSVTVNGNAQAKPSPVAAAAETEAQQLVLDNKGKLDLGTASFTFNNIVLSGNSYFRVSDAVSFALKNSYIATAYTAGNECHNAPIFSDGQLEGEFEFTLDNNVFTTARAAYMYRKVQTATITGNVFGSEDARMSDEWAVKFMQIGTNAKFDISNNTVYGATVASGDNTSFYAFYFYSDDVNAHTAENAYTAKFEANTINVTDGATEKGNFGIVKVESDYVGSEDKGAKGKIYFLAEKDGKTNTVNGSADLFNAVAYTTHDGKNTSSDKAFSLIAFNAEFDGEKLTKGYVYLGTDFGSEHSYKAENLQDTDVKDGTTNHNVWIIDLAFEDPLGYVQHVADHTDHYYINNVEGFLTFHDFVNNKTNYADKTVVQTCSLDLEEVKTAGITKLPVEYKGNWVNSLGTETNPFKGTYDGSYDGTVNTISNLTSAFFAYTDGAAVKDLKVNGVTVGGTENVGALISVAKSDTTIENVAITGATLTLNAPNAGATDNANSIGAFVGTAEGTVTLKAVSATEVEYDNTYAAQNKNFNVYNHGLVGSTSSGEEANITVQVGPGSATDKEYTLGNEFSAIFQGYIVATKLNLDATFGINDNADQVLWTAHDLDGFLNFTTIVNKGYNSYANETVAIGAPELDLTGHVDENTGKSLWTGIGNEAHAFKGTLMGVKVNGSYSKITGLTSALFANLEGTVKDLVIDGMTLNVDEEGKLVGLVATKAGNEKAAVIDNVSVSATSATTKVTVPPASTGAAATTKDVDAVKASDLAAAPYAFYSGEGKYTVVNSTITIGLALSKITFTAETDKASAANVTFEGDKSFAVENETFNLRGFDDPESTEPAGGDKNIVKPLAANYTFDGIKFTGSSSLDIAYASGLTLNNSVADVTYSAEGARMAFIRANKDPEADNAFGALSLNITNNTITVSTAEGDKTNLPNAIYVMWNKLQDGSVISGNTLGSTEKPLAHDAIKLSEFADEAVITIENNTIYGTTAEGDFTAFNFVQAKATAATKPATLKLNGNKVNVETSSQAKSADKPTAYANKFMLLETEGYDSINAYAYFKTYLDSANEIKTINKKTTSDATATTPTYQYESSDARSVVYEDIFNTLGSINGKETNELALFVGYGVAYNESGKITAGNFVFGQDEYWYVNGETKQTLSGNADMFKAAITELYNDVAADNAANMHIVIGNDFGRNLADFDATSGEGKATGTPYYIYSNPTGLETFKALVEAGYDFEGKTVKLDIGASKNVETDQYTLDLSAYIGTDNAWAPIGQAHPFNGTFDGAYQVEEETRYWQIVGLTYTGAATSFGFFAQTGEDAVIKNLTFTATITVNTGAAATAGAGNLYIGVVTAEAAGSTFENISVTGTSITVAKGTQKDATDPNVAAIGLVAGYANGGTFSNITISGANVTSNGANVGGIIGKAAGEVAVTGALVGVNAVANPAGQMPYEPATGSAAVNLTGTAAVGGVIGAVEKAMEGSNSITVGGEKDTPDTVSVYCGANVNMTNAVNDTFLKIGGIIGYVDSTGSSSTYTLNNVHFNGKLSRTIKANAPTETNNVTTVYANYGLVGSDTTEGISKLTIKNSTNGSEPVKGYKQHTVWDNNGYDATKSNYQISTAEGLAYFAQQVNGGKDYAGETVKVVADIDLSAYTGDKAWTPIGTTSHAFNGTFTAEKTVEEGATGAAINVDGKATGYTFLADAYTISNLNVALHKAHNFAAGAEETCVAAEPAGLFGVTGDDATIEYLNINGATVTGHEYIGTIVGKANGAAFNNITIANATLTGHHFVGGLAGHVTGEGTIEKVTVVGLNATAYPDTTKASTATKLDNGDKVGGLLGYINVEAKTITGNVVAYSNVTAYRDIGGLVGMDNGSGTDTGKSTFEDNTVDNVTINVKRTGFKEAGDFLGYSTEDYVEEKPQNAEWFVGRRGYTDASVNEADGTSNNARKNVTINYADAYNASHFIFDNGAWHISNITGLLTFRGLSSAEVTGGGEATHSNGTYKDRFADATVVLDADLDLSELEDETWDSVTNFKGTFDGRGHKISNMTVNAATGLAGLFANLSGATVQDLTIENANVTGGTAGVLAGEATDATIKNVTLSGTNTVTANGASAIAGGLVGKFTGSTAGKSIENITIGGTLNVTAQNTTSTTGGESATVLAGNAGGLVGSVEGTNGVELNAIDINVSAGTVRAATAGGVIGSAAGKVTVGATADTPTGEPSVTVPVYTVSSNMAVEGTTTAGGFAGTVTAASTSVSDVHITGNVTGTTAAAGFIGVLNAAGTYGNTAAIVVETTVSAGENGTAAAFATYGENAKTATVTQFTFRGTLTGKTTVYLKGVKADGSPADNTPTFKSSYVYISGKTTGYKETDFFFFGAYADVNSNAHESAVGEYFIMTQDGFMNFFAHLNGGHNFADETVVLTTDITLNAWTVPTGTFSGTFEGNNYTVKLENVSNPVYTTLFGTVKVTSDTKLAVINELKLEGLAVANTLENVTLSKVEVKLSVSAVNKALYGLAETKTGNKVTVSDSSIEIKCDDYEAKFTWDHEGKVAGGNVDTTNAFIIKTVAGLQYLAQVVNGGIGYEESTVLLDIDLDLSELEGTWEPIGNTADNPFKGTFDGGNKKISNLVMQPAEAQAAAEAPATTVAGLFGFITGKDAGNVAKVKNLTLSYVALTQNVDYAGALAGSIENATLSGITIGVMGESNNTVYISSGKDGASVGGVAGYMKNVTLNGITVVGNKNANSASVQATSTAKEAGYVGGIAGQVKGLTVETEGELSVTDMFIYGSENAGGLFGKVSGAEDLAIASATFSGRVEGSNGYNEETFGLVGSVELGSGKTLSFTGYDVTLTEASGFATEFKSNNEGTKDDTKVIEINSVAGLKHLRDMIDGGRTYEGYTITLAYAKYDLGVIYPIGGAFKGTFSGVAKSETEAEYPVITYTMSAENQVDYKVGFFGTLDGAKVEKVVFSNVKINAALSRGVGVLAAKADNATITNVTVTGETEVLGGVWVGGIVGYAVSTTFSGNSVTGTEETPIMLSVQNYKLGGIAGYLEGGAVTSNTLEYVTLKALPTTGVNADDGYGMIGGLVGGGSSAETAKTEISVNTLTGILIDASEGDKDYQKYTGALVGNPGAGEIKSNKGSGETQDGSFDVVIKVGQATDPTGEGFVGANAGTMACKLGEGETANTVKVQWINIIKDADELLAFAKAANAAENGYNGRYFLLADGVDLTDYTGKTGKKAAWTPIGTADHPFEGTFDGNGKKVSNLNASGTGAVGFFGVLNGTLKNITFDNATVTGEQAGVIAGSSKAATLEKVTLIGTLNITYAKPTKDALDNPAIGILIGVLTEGTLTVTDVEIDNTTVEHTKATLDYGADFKTNNDELKFHNYFLGYVAKNIEDTPTIVGKLGEQPGLTVEVKHMPNDVVFESATQPGQVPGSGMLIHTGVNLIINGEVEVKDGIGDGAGRTIIEVDHTAFNSYDGNGGIGEGIVSGTITIKNVHFKRVEGKDGNATGYPLVLGGDSTANVTFEKCTFDNLFSAIYINRITAGKGVHVTFKACKFINNTQFCVGIDPVSDSKLVDIKFEGTNEFGTTKKCEREGYVPADAPAQG